MKSLFHSKKAAMGFLVKGIIIPIISFVMISLAVTNFMSDSD